MGRSGLDGRESPGRLQRLTAGQRPCPAGALALKNGKPVILLAASEKAVAFFQELATDNLHVVATPREAVETIRTLL